jgi:hypothetical protein
MPASRRRGQGGEDKEYMLVLILGVHSYGNNKKPEFS